jgi:hypothetical protein
MWESNRQRSHLVRQEKTEKRYPVTLLRLYCFIIGVIVTVVAVDGEGEGGNV